MRTRDRFGGQLKREQRHHQLTVAVMDIAEEGRVAGEINAPSTVFPLGVRPLKAGDGRDRASRPAQDQEIVVLPDSTSVHVPSCTPLWWGHNRT